MPRWRFSRGRIGLPLKKATAIGGLSVTRWRLLLCLAVGVEHGLTIGTGLSSHSLVILSPMATRSFFSSAEGGSTFMLFFFSWSTYQTVFSSEVFQPRASASAAAFSRACCVGLSSASNCFWLTSTTFFGSQACTSK